ncbi:glycosyltransferase family 4 protein [Patescibacteria group bacterium]
MKIGIDASRAFLKNRTGIEEYSYRVIKNLRDKLKNHQVILYLRKGQKEIIEKDNFDIPNNWSVEEIRFPRFWTQAGLSIEMLLNPIDILFVPAHTVPIIHPKKTIVVMHGLEYEFLPKAYSFWERLYMRHSIKNSCKWASRIISVSENTKKDLIDLYRVSDDKIDVVYEGYDSSKNQISKIKNQNTLDRLGIINGEYLLFIGRIEERKNIIGIIEAFEILKKEDRISHKLVLAGRGGFGYDKILRRVEESEFKKDIILTGFIEDSEKWELLEKASLFVFPTFYEGFGIPILEAQSVGTPVLASSNSSIPEVVNGSAVLVDPNDVIELSSGIRNILMSEELADKLSGNGLENVKRFSWDRCASEIAEILEK